LQTVYHLFTRCPRLSAARRQLIEYTGHDNFYRWLTRDGAVAAKWATEYFGLVVEDWMLHYLSALDPDAPGQLPPSRCDTVAPSENNAESAAKPTPRKFRTLIRDTIVANSFNKAARAITIRITIAITITKSLHECRHHDISTLNDHGQHKLDYSAAAQTNVRQRDAQVYLRDMTQPMSVTSPPLYFLRSAATIRFYNTISSNALQPPPPPPPPPAHDAYGTHDALARSRYLTRVSPTHDTAEQLTDWDMIDRDLLSASWYV